MELADHLLDGARRRHPAQGPLILMFVALTIATLALLDRDASWLWRLRPVWGLMWTLVLVLPWFVAIYWRAGDAFFSDSLAVTC